MPVGLAIGLAAAATTGGRLIEAKMASNASKKAADTQVAASQQAIQRNDLAQQQAIGAVQEAQMRARAMPVPTYGVGAGGQVQAMQPMGAPMNGQLGRPPMGMPQGPQTMGQVMQPMVTLEAPTGQRKQVPVAQAQMYLQRGAKVVQ